MSATMPAVPPYFSRDIEMVSQEVETFNLEEKNQKLLDFDGDLVSAPKSSKFLGALTFIGVLTFVFLLDLGLYALRLNNFKIHHADVILSTSSCSIGDVSCLDSQVLIHQNIPTRSSFFNYNLNSASTCQLTTTATNKEDATYLIDFKPSLSSASNSDSSVFDFGGVQSTMKLDVTGLDFTELRSFASELLSEPDKDTKTVLAYQCKLQLDVVFLLNKDFKLFSSPTKSLKNSFDLSNLDLSKSLRSRSDDQSDRNVDTSKAQRSSLQDQGGSITDMGHASYPLNYQLNIPAKIQSTISKSFGYVTVSIPAVALSVAPSADLLDTLQRQQQHKLKMTIEPFTVDTRDAQVQTDIKLSCYMGDNVDRQCAVLSPGVDAYRVLTALQMEDASVDIDVNVQSNPVVEEALGARHKMTVNRGSAALMSARRQLSQDLLDQCVAASFDGHKFFQLCGKKTASNDLTPQNGGQDNAIITTQEEPSSIIVDDDDAIINYSLDGEYSFDMSFLSLSISTDVELFIYPDSATIRIGDSISITADMKGSYDQGDELNGNLLATISSPDLTLDMMAAFKLVNTEVDGVGLSIVSYLKENKTDSDDAYVWYDFDFAAGAVVLDETTKEGVSISGIAMRIDTARLVVMDTEFMDGSMSLELAATDDLMSGVIRIYVGDTHNSKDRVLVVENMQWHIADDLTTMRFSWYSVLTLLGVEHFSMDMKIGYSPNSFGMSIDESVMDQHASVGAVWDLSAIEMGNIDSKATVKVAIRSAEEASMAMQWYIATAGSSLDNLSVQFDVRMLEQVKALGQETKQDSGVMWMNASIAMEPNKVMRVGMAVQSTMVSMQREMNNEEPKHPEYFVNEAASMFTADNVETGSEVAVDVAVMVQDGAVTELESYGLDVLASPALYAGYLLIYAADTLLGSSLVPLAEVAMEVAQAVVEVGVDNSNEMNSYKVYGTMSIVPLSRASVVIPEPPTMAPTMAAVASIAIRQTLTGLKYIDYAKNPKSGKAIIVASVLSGLPTSSKFTAENVVDLKVKSKAHADQETDQETVKSKAHADQETDQETVKSKAHTDQETDQETVKSKVHTDQETDPETVIAYRLIVYPENNVGSLTTLVEQYTDYANSRQFTQKMSEAASSAGVQGYSSVSSVVVVEAIDILSTPTPTQSPSTVDILSTPTPTQSPSTVASSKSSDGNMGIIIGCVVGGFALLVLVVGALYVMMTRYSRNKVSASSDPVTGAV